MQNNVDYKSIQKDHQLAKKQIETLENKLRDLTQSMQDEKHTYLNQIDNLTISLESGRQDMEGKESELESLTQEYRQTCKQSLWLLNEKKEREESIRVLGQQIEQLEEECKQEKLGRQKQ